MMSNFLHLYFTVELDKAKLIFKKRTNNIKVDKQ